MRRNRQRWTGRPGVLLGLFAVIAGCGHGSGGTDSSAASVTGGDGAADASSDATDVPTCDRVAPVIGRGGEFMLPGSDCLTCHRTGGAATTVFTVAGTVFASTSCADPLAGATVKVVDMGGVLHSLTTNEEGNFFTTETIPFPVSVSVEHGTHVAVMASAPPTGSCGHCHTTPVPGRTLGFVTPN